MGEEFQVKVIISHGTYNNCQPGSQVVFQKGMMDAGKDTSILIEKV